MTLNRSVIHFNDNSLHKPVSYPNHDSLHKIRPEEAHLNKLFLNVAPFEQTVLRWTDVRISWNNTSPTSPINGVSSYMFCVHCLVTLTNLIFFRENRIFNTSDEPGLGVVGNSHQIVPFNSTKNEPHHFDNFYFGTGTSSRSTRTQILRVPWGNRIGPFTTVPRTTNFELT